MHIAMIITPLFIGYPEIILIVVLALIFFGGKKIPELMRGVGRGVKEFKDAVNKDYTAEQQDNGAAETPAEPADAESVAEARPAENLPAAEPEKAPAKRRGRPRKSAESAVPADAAAAKPRRRGRPAKQKSEGSADGEPKRRPGRPKKVQD